MPQLDYVLLVSRWIHIGAAMVAIGGAVFLRFALKPSAKEVLDDDQHQRLSEVVRRRWARLLYPCIALLLLTGSANFIILAILPHVEPMPYHAIFGVKLLAALAVFFLGSALAGRSPGLAKIRQDSAKWLSRLLVLAALIVLLSGVLAQVRSDAKAKAKSLDRSSGIAGRDAPESIQSLPLLRLQP